MHILFWYMVLDVHGDCILDSMNNESDPVYCSVLHFYFFPQFNLLLISAALSKNLTK